MPVISIDRQRRRTAAENLAKGQGNVATRRQLYACGLTRSDVRAEILARRWKRRGDQCVQVGEAGVTTGFWVAVLEVGPAAVLDGVSALLVAGLRTINADQIHVAVPQGGWLRRRPGVVVHETRRLRAEDVIRDRGIPRTEPATAAVHAALWAVSDSQAALFIVAPVQQRLVTVEDLRRAIALVKRHKRRRLLLGLLADVSGGVESIGEREFAAACRRRGFPEPTRQVKRRLPSGNVVYDNVWEDYLEVEIDGAQHLDVAMATGDMLKQNAAALTGKVVLRIPNFAFRANPDPFLDQMEAVFRARGWKPQLRQRKRAS